MLSLLFCSHYSHHLLLQSTMILLPLFALLGLFSPVLALINPIAVHGRYFIDSVTQEPV